jgi:chemotaxis protein MotA
LANMLQTLSSDPTQIGSGMAVALITTMYGVLLSNLVFKPMALRIERLAERRIESLRILLEGILLMKERRSPTAIRETLRSLVEAPADAEMSQPRRARAGGLSKLSRA